MKKQPELEAKYQVRSVELQRFKNGQVDVKLRHNVWYFIQRTYWKLSLRLRLIRLKYEFEENLITREQYDNWKEIIHLAI